MSGNLCDLYQELILDHGRSPRNFGELVTANCSAEGYNHLCGDHITVQLVLDDDDIVQDLKFQGAGCAISTASASLMTQTLKGLHIDEVRKRFEGFHDMVTADQVPGEQELVQLGKLAVFEGVRNFPTRVKCATLAWHTVRAAIEKTGETATTE